MRTRDVIEASEITTRDAGLHTTVKDLQMQGLMLEVLLDIRDLLAVRLPMPECIHGNGLCYQPEVHFADKPA